MKVITSEVKFEKVTKYSKLQQAVAKLFSLSLAHRYTMEAKFKLGPADKLQLQQDIIDNCGNEWYVVSRNPATNEYCAKSGLTVPEQEGSYFLTHVSVIE